MSNPFIRSQLVLGEEGLKKIANARVAVFGVGGVGGYVIEALARCGIGEIDIIDNDTVAESNINRQIIATHSTIGEYKVDVMEKRIKEKMAVKHIPVGVIPMEDYGRMDGTKVLKYAYSLMNKG